MLMNPSLMFEMSTALCLVKEDVLERSGCFKGSVGVTKHKTLIQYRSEPSLSKIC